MVVVVEVGWSSGRGSRSALVVGAVDKYSALLASRSPYIIIFAEAYMGKWLSRCPFLGEHVSLYS